jgi:hypothetical protein
MIGPSPRTAGKASRRVVHFDEGEPRCYIDRHQFTEYERKAYWLQVRDFAAFQRHTRAHIRALYRCKGHATKLDPTRWCFRGIEECLSEDYAARLAAQRNALVNAVLEEQDRQNNEQTYDDIALYDVSKSLSEVGRLHAIELGRHDARVAQTGEDEPIPIELPSISESRPLFPGIEVSTSLEDSGPSSCTPPFVAISINQHVLMSA